MKHPFPPLLAGLLLLAGCAAPPAPPPPESGQQALFDDYPAQLFGEAALACAEIGAEVDLANRDDLSCAQLPEPALAAALILDFEGSVEELPTLVSRFHGQSTAAGYLVTVDNFIRVPGRDGLTRQVRLPSPGLDAAMREMLRRAGGQPL